MTRRGESRPRLGVSGTVKLGLFLMMGTFLAVDGLAGSSHKPQKKAGSVPAVLTEGGALNKGGFILNQAVARGVNCPDESGSTFRLSGSNTISNKLVVNAQLAQTRGYYGENSTNPTVYVGQQTAVDGGASPEVAAEGGALTWLSKGWALSYNTDKQTYTLDHFQAEPVATEPIPDGTVTIGKLVGERVMSTDLVGLELGAMARTHTDGQTAASVTTMTSWDTLQPLIDFQVQCEQ